ncbi:3-hydroxyanthranilate 3,4-dioxygenase [Rhodocaloribacter sp.]
MNKPFNLQEWIDAHRDVLKPPVMAKPLFDDSGDYMIFVVGSPNTRKDFHYNETEEFFHQLEGELHLWTIDEEGRQVENVIRAGEVFLLPARVPHSPRRPAGGIGIVVERKRPGMKDGVMWFCENCGEKLYEQYFPVEEIANELGPVLEAFAADEELRTCKKCGAVLEIAPTS